MSRDMTKSSSLLFAHLESYCARRGEPVLTPGEPRWIKADNAAARDAFRLANLVEVADFGHQRKLAWLSVGTAHYVCSIGFEHEPALSQLKFQETHSGFVAALIADCLPMPTASPAQVRNVVEAGSKEDAGYMGHDARLIEGLFPAIQVWESVGALESEATWRLFLMTCAEECRLGGSWIDDNLADRLASLTDLAIPHMPYRALCHSMFDADPRTMFLALYRCLEATYAYNSAHKLVRRLNLAVNWVALARALDEEVGWHPHEASSLNLILSHALESDLEELCDAMGQPVGKDVHSAAGKAIYALRNRIVHYRSGSEAVALTDYDWNAICSKIVDVVFHVFTHAFPPYPDGA